MTGKRISETAFDPGASRACDLFLVLEDEQILLSVVNQQNDYLAFSQVFPNHKILSPEALREATQKEEWLRLPYRSVSVGISDHHFSFLPERLYDGQDLSRYFSLLLDEEEGSFQDDILDQPGLRNIFFIKNNLKEALKEQFPTHRLCHFSSALISAFYQHSLEMEGPKVYLYVSGHHLYISHFRGHDLVFFNRFTFRSTRDFLYFTLLLYRQFDLKPDQVPVLLSGSLLKDSSIYELLFRYLRKVAFLPLPPFLNFQSVVRQEQSHLFFGTYAMKLCGS